MLPAAEREEREILGITCPPDRVPQTPAGGLRPPVTCPPDRVPPAQQIAFTQKS